MNNFLYAVLLIWFKALHLADTDCTVPDIANVYVNNDDNCKDITITCQRGYRMRSTMNCGEGPWIFEDLVCLPVQCLDEPEIINGALDAEIMSRNFGDQYGFNCDPYFIKNGDKGTVTCTETGKWETNITCEDCFIRKLGVRTIYDPYTVDTEDECQLKCEETCTIVENRTPNSDGVNCRIYKSPALFRSNEMSLPECIQKCNNLPKCLTMNYFELNTCRLFSFTVDELNATGDIRHYGDPNEIIAGKNTCPTIV